MTDLQQAIIEELENGTGFDELVRVYGIGAVNDAIDEYEARL